MKTIVIIAACAGSIFAGLFAQRYFDSNKIQRRNEADRYMDSIAVYSNKVKTAYEEKEPLRGTFEMMQEQGERNIMRDVVIETYLKKLVFYTERYNIAKEMLSGKQK